MAFANSAKTQNESATIGRRARLIGMPHDAWIEQGGSLERIFVEKISPDQTTLRLGQLGVWFERVFHAGGARFENVEQVPVATLEVFEHLAQQLRGRFGIEPKHPVDNVIGTDLVSRVEVSRLSRWLEGPDDDPCRIRA